MSAIIMNGNKGLVKEYVNEGPKDLKQSVSDLNASQKDKTSDESGTADRFNNSSVEHDPNIGNNNIININNIVDSNNPDEDDSDSIDGDSDGGRQGIGQSGEANVEEQTLRDLEAVEPEPAHVMPGGEAPDVTYEDLGAVRPEDLEVEDPAFTQLDLWKICNSPHNVGELKLTRKGKLEKINNHVGIRVWENEVKLTPEENLAVRRQVCKCLVNYAEECAPANSDKVEGLKRKLEKLLLNDRDRATALSRDEVNFLHRMIWNTYAPRPEGNAGYTVENYLKLHDFKVGKLTDPEPVRQFVKGLGATSELARRVAGAVSVNAQQGLVPVTLYEIRKIFKTMLAESPSGIKVSSSRLIRTLCAKAGLNSRGANIDKDAVIVEKDLRKFLINTQQMYEERMSARIRKNETDRATVATLRKRELYALFSDAVRRSEVRTFSPFVAISRNLPMIPVPKSRLDLFVATINEVMRSRNPVYINNLKSLFGKTSCKLWNARGELVEYQYAQFKKAGEDVSDEVLFGRIVRYHVAESNIQRISGKYKGVWNLSSNTSIYRMLGFKYARQNNGNIVCVGVKNPVTAKSISPINEEEGEDDDSDNINNINNINNN